MAPGDFLQLHHGHSKSWQQASKVSLVLALQHVQSSCHRAHDLGVLLEVENVRVGEVREVDPGHNSSNSLPEKKICNLIKRMVY
jgi:hypothetical protein